MSPGTHLLAKLYDGDLQAQMRKLEVQLKIAEQTEKRQAELLKIQGISQQEYDLSLLQVLNLKADMDIIKERYPQDRNPGSFCRQTWSKECQSRSLYHSGYHTHDYQPGQYFKNPV